MRKQRGKRERERKKMKFWVEFPKYIVRRDFRNFFFVLILESYNCLKVSTV